MFLSFFFSERFHMQIVHSLFVSQMTLEYGRKASQTYKRKSFPRGKKKIAYANEKSYIFWKMHSLLRFLISSNRMNENFFLIFFRFEIYFIWRWHRCKVAAIGWKNTRNRWASNTRKNYCECKILSLHLDAPILMQFKSDN